MKAVFLLVLTNLGVMIVLSVVLHIFGIDQALQQQGGVAPGGLILMACIYGFIGSFISLMLSKSMAKRQMGVQVITEPRNETEQWLVNTVSQLAQKAGVGMPEVGIFDNPAPNAFATGASKNASLIAVSTGLLQSMDREEVSAVLGHEMTHVSNGDMVTSALVQGTINSFVIVFAQIISSLVARDRDGRRDNGLYFMVYMILQVVLGFLGSMVVMWHSRHREFAADRGGAALAGKRNMINALRALQTAQEHGAHGALAKDFQAFGIVAVNGLFASHPPLEVRIAALEKMTDIA